MNEDINEEKTVQQFLKEKLSLQLSIQSEVEYFLKENPNVKWISFDSNINEIQMKCGVIKEFNLIIKTEL